MKNGTFIDISCNLNLLDIITHVEIGNAIKCVLKNILYGYLHFIQSFILLFISSFLYFAF
jgi:hypothetical protein